MSTDLKTRNSHSRLHSKNGVNEEAIHSLIQGFFAMLAQYKSKLNLTEAWRSITYYLSIYSFYALIVNKIVFQLLGPIT